MDEYFLPNNHIKSYDYRKFKDDEKEASFNQAVRELIANQGRELVDPDTDDVYRDDYAIFEQALFILINTPRRGADGGMPVIDLAEKDEKNILERKGKLVSPEAALYLRMNRVQMIRG